MRHRRALHHQGYRYEARQISNCIGSERLSELSVTTVNNWMAQMVEDGYAPKTVTKPFRLLKQALNFAIAQDLITKNPCNFCKPPKREKTKINALSREDHSRMLDLARGAFPKPLALAIELALTTGMRLGEVSALRWSDLGDNGVVTVRTNNVQERMNCELKRRAKVVQAFPSTGSVLRLLGGIVGEINADWETGSRFMSAESLGPVLALERAENRIDDFTPDEEVRSSARMIMMMALDEYAKAA